MTVPVGEVGTGPRHRHGLSPRATARSRALGAAPPVVDVVPPAPAVPPLAVAPPLD